jgi:cellulose synthase/poly-beta-1,6-N-acetylglucosamine synthase-like glycosyltransferase
VLELAARALFWATIITVFVAYGGYPLVMIALARLRPARSIRGIAGEPAVSLIIVAHNEEHTIESKLQDCLSQDYPAHALEIIVVSDGSTDATDAIVERHADRGVRLFRTPRPSGKPTGLNLAAAQARGEVLVLCDARQRLDRACVRTLVDALGDPAVGAASGELHIDAGDGSVSGEGVGAYWRFEKLIRQAEASFDSTVGVTGAIYAVRRSLFPELDPRTILDDVAVPMAVIRAGSRVIFEARAQAFDRAPASAHGEYRRKVRTLAGNLQLVALQPWLLDPRANRLFWQFLCHKLLRLAVPWALVVLLAANTVLVASSGGALYRVALVGQLAVYGLALAGWAAEQMGRRVRLLAVPYAFALLNLACAAAPFFFIGGKGRADWKNVEPQ